MQAILCGQAAKATRYHSAQKRDVACEVDLAATVDYVAPSPGVSSQEDLALAEALEALPETMREVVLRRVFEGEPFDQIARDLGRPASTVRVLWVRALRKLRERLGE